MGWGQPLGPPVPGITPTGSVGHTTAAISGGEAHELATATATRCSNLYVVVGSVPVCCSGAAAAPANLVRLCDVWRGQERVVQGEEVCGRS